MTKNADPQSRQHAYLTLHRGPGEEPTLCVHVPSIVSMRPVVHRGRDMVAVELRVSAKIYIDPASADVLRREWRRFLVSVLGPILGPLPEDIDLNDALGERTQRQARERVRVLTSSRNLLDAELQAAKALADSWFTGTFAARETWVTDEDPADPSEPRPPGP